MPAGRAAYSAACIAIGSLLGVAHAGAADTPLRLRLAPECVSCATLADARAPSATEAILAVQVNLESKGDYLVLIAQDGDVLLRDEDFAALGLEALARQPTLVEGAPYVSLRALDGVAFAIDMERLVLALRVAPRHLAGRQVFDLSPRRAEDVLRPAPAGAFFNYNLNHTRADGLRATFDAAGELGVRLGEYLLSSDGYSVQDPTSGERRNVRLSSAVVRDRRDTLQRLALGDFLTVQPGPLGSSLRLGGISFSRRFSIDPYYVRFPGQVVAGSAALPSEVFVYSNGVLIRRERVTPGTFELQNLVRQPGLQLTEIVVRDVLGNEQRIADPFYYSESLLRPGVDEYSFDAGVERRQFGVRSADYGAFGVSAFYRRGITPGLTLGGHGERLDGRYSAGPMATLAAGAWGVTSLALAVGGSREGRGAAASVAHAFSSARWSASAALRLEAREFRRAGSEVLGPRRYDFAATFSRALSAGSSASLAFAATAPWLARSSRSSALSYRMRAARDVYLSATARHVSGALPLNEVFLTLSWHFDAAGKRHLASLQARRAADTAADTSGALVQLAGGNPEAEGWSYRVQGETQHGDALRRRTFNPAAQWNGQHAVVRAESFHDSTTGGERVALGLQGGIATVGGHWALTRPVGDSFAIVKLGEVQGVRVYANNQPVATTDASGSAFVPRLASYFENPVGIEHKDLPINVIVPRTRYVVSPGLRSGVLLDFRAREVSAVSGRLVRRAPGASRPFGDAQGEVAVGDERRELFTASDGRFYLENMAPGRYAGEAARDGTLCRFHVEVPASKDVVTELGEVACEN